MVDRTGRSDASVVFWALDMTAELLRAFLTGEIGGAAAVRILEKYLIRMRGIANISQLLGEEEIEAGAATAEEGAFEGDAGDLNLEIGDAQQSLGTLQIGVSAAARIAVYLIDLTIDIILLFD